MQLQLKAGRLVAFALAGISVFLASAEPSAASAVSDPSDDFLPTFAGVHNGDLDVVAVNVTLDGSNLDFAATMNDVVGLTPGSVYVFGINRGQGTAKFGNIGAGGVFFDSTFVINQSSVGIVNDLINHTSTAISSVGAVKLLGSTISGVVPVSDLPSEGFSPSEYQYNIWPELGAANPGNTEISDFAPNNSDSAVSVAAPEPTTMSLVGGIALIAFGLFRRRKRTDRIVTGGFPNLQRTGEESILLEGVPQCIQPTRTSSCPQTRFRAFVELTI